MSTPPTPEEFMQVATLKDIKNAGGYVRGERSGEGENPPRATTGTRGDERGEN